MWLVPKRKEEGSHSLIGDRWSSLFDDFFGSSPMGSENGTAVPALDVTEDENAVTVTAELPGMDRKDVDLSVEDGVLTLRGEKKLAKEAKGRNYHHVERQYGSFRRSVMLPDTVDAAQSKADYKDGVLTVTISKSEDAKPRRIQIDLK